MPDSKINNDDVVLTDDSVNKEMSIAEWFKKNERELLYGTVIVLLYKNRRLKSLLRRNTKQLVECTKALNEAEVYLKSLSMAMGLVEKSA